MTFKKSNKSKGAISTTFLILGVVLLVVIIGVFVIVKVNSAKNTVKQTGSSENTNEPAGPVYDTQLGDVKFIFQSAVDVGMVLKSPDPRYQKELVTTERFIKVTIGVQNKGKLNVAKTTWNIGNIVDSEGRNFVPVNPDQNTYSSNSSNLLNLCGTLLKPEFEPTPCVKYYEVSKESTGLKVQVYISAVNSTKVKQEGFVDLIVQ